jgi:hypothetical protein
METCTLQVECVGQIEHAEVRFGDLTILVGPQATGKSIFLEILKLCVDTGAILADLKRSGLDWGRDTAQFLDIYLGEGMRGVWREGQSCISFNRKAVDLEKLVGRQKANKEESMFFIPAQRVLTLGKGWPRPFTDYGAGDPFTVRDFSEKLRLLMESDLGRGESLFPKTRRLKSEVQDLLRQTVFSNFGLGVDKHGAQKRLILSSPQANDSLPFMVWSAGQREFVPLLLGFYWLLPPTKVSRRGNLEWAVIEEPEMGLHPKAILVVLLLVLELLSRGYRVCLSTHSPHVLNVVWALKVFQRHHAKWPRLLELFDLPHSPSLGKMAKEVLTKDARVYYFDPKSGRATDISNLDPGAAEPAESGWGGLVEFSGRVADVVADVVGNSTEQ